VRLQAKAGIDVVSDSEYGKSVNWAFMSTGASPASLGGRAIVTGAITYTGTAELQRDIANLKASLAKGKGVTGFLPVVAPASESANR